jgi:endo-1,4-beta-xylanase
MRKNKSCRMCLHITLIGVTTCFLGTESFSQILQMPTGRRLRTIAEEKRVFYMGTSSSAWDLHSQNGEGSAIQTVMNREYNMVSWDNTLKPFAVHPERNTYDFSGPDVCVAYGTQHAITTHGHLLVAQDGYNADWLKSTSLTASDLDAIMVDHIQTVMGRYKKGSSYGYIPIWDVVNEAIQCGSNGGDWPNGTNGWRMWYNNWLTMGYDADGIPKYISRAFEIAHQVDSTCMLVYNEGQDAGYGIEYINPQSDIMYTMCQTLLARGVPIDAVGFQCHVNGDDNELNNLNTMAANIDRFAALGLKVLITELDVWISDKSDASLQMQADVYRKILNICLSRATTIVAVQTWGMFDHLSWLTYYATNGQVYPLPFDNSYNAKPAYYAMQSELENFQSSLPTQHQSPYGGTSLTLPGRIEAENYDSGGQSIAFYDIDDTSFGTVAPRNDAVDFKSAGNDNYIVGWNAPGEWREYTVDIPIGSYSIIARVAAEDTNARMVINLGDGPEGTNFVTLDTMRMANAAGFDSLKTDTLRSVEVNNGGNSKVLRLETVGGYFDIDWVEFSSTTTELRSPGRPRQTGKYEYQIVSLNGRMLRSGTADRTRFCIAGSQISAGVYLRVTNTLVGNKVMAMVNLH